MPSKLHRTDDEEIDRRLTMSENSTSSSDFLRTFQTVLQKIVEAGDEQPTEETSDGMHRLLARHDLKALMALHLFVSKHRFQDSAPSPDKLEDLNRTVNESLKERLFSDSVQELVQLLSRPHLQAVFRAHDDVANRRYEPLLPDIPFEVDEDEGVAVKVVRLVKNQEPLGATIKCQPDGSVVIARVIRGGVADRSGCIQMQDRVIEVNGVAVAGKQPHEIVHLLSGSNGTVTFKLIPADDEFLSADQRSASLDASRPRVRAQFDYDPLQDHLHPCPEAGLAFRIGDVLELVECDDEHWWQARNEGRLGPDLQTGSSGDGRVGLIPSRTLQEKRTSAAKSGKGSSLGQSVMQQTTGTGGATGTLDSRRSVKSASPRLRKIVYETQQADELETDEVRAYEDVALLYPRPDLVRPVVLIGPPGVGRNELKRRLLMLNPDRFATTIPHTSRPARPHETAGVDYHFACRTEMEQWVRQGKFLEYGEYKGNLYGTLDESVRALVAQGRMPILNPHPQALRLLRTAEFKPFIVFVKPPPFPALKETRSTTRARSAHEGAYRRGFTDLELEQMLQSAGHLHRHYGHWFHYELVNGNLEFAFRELCDLLQRVDTEAHWVAAGWLR